MLFPVLLTGKLTGEDLSSKTQAAVPALRKDANVARHHGRSELTHHRCVLIHIPIEQLQRKITQKRKVTMSFCWTLAIIYTVWFHSPIQRSHHAVWSNLDCRCWRPHSRTTRNPHWEENEIHQSLFLLIRVGIFYWYCRDIVILNSSGQNNVVVKDSQLLRVSSLSDDPSELHLSTGVHLKPVDCFLWLCTPRSAVQILVVSRALQVTTQLLSGLAFHPEN